MFLDVSQSTLLRKHAVLLVLTFCLPFLLWIGKLTKVAETLISLMLTSQCWNSQFTGFYVCFIHSWLAIFPVLILISFRYHFQCVVLNILTGVVNLDNSVLALMTIISLVQNCIPHRVKDDSFPCTSIERQCTWFDFQPGTQIPDTGWFSFFLSISKWSM